MKNKNILTTGKFFFWLSLILGNICLFGYLITKDEDFAFYGFMLLIFGSILNILVITSLLVYGSFNKIYLDTCYKSAGIILINIPIAILYAVIGISILNL
ncbi:MAG: hypothetical protein K0R36_1790 [Chryseobacterium sp.]|jgi:LIVCS family branched-chain amino acid:cation transporter|nr:hypothetical protein [Chryseobacterium sp.]